MIVRDETLHIVENSGMFKKNKILCYRKISPLTPGLQAKSTSVGCNLQFANGPKSKNRLLNALKPQIK